MVFGMVRFCFVCLGNICRSPTAEAVMRDLVRRAGLEDAVEIASAGTGDWHVGQTADPRSIAAAKERGITIAGRARQWDAADWNRFDYVLAMDRKNFNELRKTAPSGVAEQKLHMFRSFDPDAPAGASVPDPYLGEGGFDVVIDQCVAACAPLLDHARKFHGLA
jgi:protein-tyrosine phosphatase